MPEVSRRRLALALRYFTHAPLYLRALVEGADRIGLDGAPAGTADAAAHAAAELARRSK